MISDGLRRRRALVPRGHLADVGEARHPGLVEDVEATQLVFETPFDMRAMLYEIRDVLIEPEDGDEETEEDA